MAKCFLTHFPCVLMCSLSLSCLLKFLLHPVRWLKGHFIPGSAECIFICLLRLSDLLNIFSQVSHWYSASWLCVKKCFFRYSCVAKLFWQMEHWKPLFSWSWWHLWTCKSSNFWLEKTCKHCSHLRMVLQSKWRLNPCLFKSILELLSNSQCWHL